MVVWVALFGAGVLLYFSYPLTLSAILVVFLYRWAPVRHCKYIRTPQLVHPQPPVETTPKPLCASPQLDASLRQFIQGILKAYVLGWHSTISPHSDVFHRELRDTLEDAFRELCGRCELLDWPSFAIGTVVPLLDSHLKAFAAADAQIKQSGQYTRLSETEALQARVAEAYGSVASLHANVENPDEALLIQAQKLAGLILPPELLAYKPAYNFIVTLLSNAVLLPILNLLSSGDFINQNIVRGCETTLRDSARVYRLRKMVQLSLSKQLPPMTLETDEKGYQEYLEALRTLQSLALARQTMYSIRLLINKLRNLEGPYKLYSERLGYSMVVLAERIKQLDPHSLDEGEFDFNSVLSSPECLPLFEEYMRCQPFDWLSVYNKIARLGSSVDPLGGFEIQTPEAIEANTEIVGDIFGMLSTQNKAGEFDLDPLEAFLEEPNHANYTRVQRVAWQIRDTLVQKLQLQVVSFKESVYFVQYITVAGNRRESVDKLQTDEIELGDSLEGDINNEMVRSAIEDAMLDDPEPLQAAGPRLSEVTVQAQIEQFENQIELLKPLITKAELTNDQNELRILHKSTRSLEREIGRLRLETLPRSPRDLDECELSICSCETSTDSNGEFTTYVVSVKTPTSDWTVSRRYRQFYALQKILRVDIPALGDKFPRKKVVLKFQQRQFVENRKHALEAWLQRAYSLGREHPALRSFLVDDAFSGTFDQPASMVQPICDLFLTLFNENNELRGKAIVLVVQQVLGGTIEKRIREVGLSLPNALPGWIDAGRAALWPEVPRNAPERTLAERIYARDHAALLLPRVTKFWLGRIVGAYNCDSASRMVLEMLQNNTLNKHLVLSVLESLVEFVARGQASMPSTPVL